MENETPRASKQDARADQGHGVNVDLIALLVAVTDSQPCVLTIGQANALPSGPFELGHRSLQSGLRAWVERQTGHPLGYIEQLYTFADRDRIGDEPARRAISISYLGLTSEEQSAGVPKRGWRSWYDYFPWEDHRAGAPSILPDVLEPGLRAWANEAGNAEACRERWQRAAIAFGFDARGWNDEFTLQRYELLYEAALVVEAARGRDMDKARPVPGSTVSAGEVIRDGSRFGPSPFDGGADRAQFPLSSERRGDRNRFRSSPPCAATQAKIVCTRKTTPGLRALEKYAVRAGGGANHRFSLADGVLIKDNHIAIAGDIRIASERGGPAPAIPSS